MTSQLPWFAGTTLPSRASLTVRNDLETVALHVKRKVTTTRTSRMEDLAVKSAIAEDAHDWLSRLTHALHSNRWTAPAARSVKSGLASGLYFSGRDFTIWRRRLSPAIAM